LSQGLIGQVNPSKQTQLLDRLLWVKDLVIQVCQIEDVLAIDSTDFGHRHLPAAELRSYTVVKGVATHAGAE
jgi:hypothetical protein